MEWLMIVVINWNMTTVVQDRFQTEKECRYVASIIIGAAPTKIAKGKCLEVKRNRGVIDVPFRK